LTEDDICDPFGNCAGIAIIGSCGEPNSLLELPFEISDSTLGRPSALSDYSEDCGGTGQNGADLIYEIVLPAGELWEFRFSPEPDFDGALRVLEVCGDQASCLGSANKGEAGEREFVRLTAEKQRIIYLVVEAGASGSSGDFDLSAVRITDEKDTETASATDGETNTDPDADTVGGTEMHTESETDSENEFKTDDAVSSEFSSETEEGSDSDKESHRDSETVEEETNASGAASSCTSVARGRRMALLGAFLLLLIR
jgi:hypothetical protein